MPTERKVRTRTYSIAVSTESKQVCPENPRRAAIYMILDGAGPAYVTHGQSVPASQGYPVSNTMPLKNDSTTAELWAVMSAGTAILYVMEDTEE